MLILKCQSESIIVDERLSITENSITETPIIYFVCKIN